MQRVRLLGELGERFGAEYTYYNLRHPADAIKLLCINRPDFKDYLLKADENGIGFKVIQSEVEMGYEDLLLPLGQRELVIVPVMTGSGGSFGKILAGIGLVALSFLLPGAGIFGATSIFGISAAGATGAGVVAGSAFLTSIGTAISGIGASLIIGGVAQMISPQPQMPTFAGGFAGNRFGSRNRTGGPVGVTRGVDGEQSYAYTGAANTAGVGATVPLAYGKVLIGSHLLRSRVEVADESDPTLSSIKLPGPDTFLIGGEKITTTFSDVSGAVVRRAFPDPVTFKASPAANIATSSLYATETGAVTLDVNKVDAQRKNFNVALRLSNGLFAFAGGAGTTKVDAFITYEINVYKGTSVSANNLIAVDQASIQALLNPNQLFTWIHKMELPTLSTSATKVTVQLKIIDTDGDNGVQLGLPAIGYNLT